uniref:Uncharacterized protein n=1 Tax=Arundo donax TaxID=35708 RepID=A0A0A9AQS1_ARUDO
MLCISNGQTRKIKWQNSSNDTAGHSFIPQYSLFTPFQNS